MLRALSITLIFCKSQIYPRVECAWLFKSPMYSMQEQRKQVSIRRSKIGIYIPNICPGTGYKVAMVGPTLIDAAALHISNVRGKPQTVFQQWAIEMLNN